MVNMYLSNMLLHPCQPIKKRSQCTSSEKTKLDYEKNDHGSSHAVEKVVQNDETDSETEHAKKAKYQSYQMKPVYKT